MKIYQHAELSDDPTQAMDAVTKQYVDALLATVSEGAGGSVFITDLTPTSTGIVGSKVYTAGTVPANYLVDEATSDTSSVTVTVLASGSGSAYTPTVTITASPSLGGTGAVSLTQITSGANAGKFSGTLALTGVTSGDYTLTATSSTGAVDTAVIHRAVAGPDVTSVTIGALPGSQTQAKSGDTVAVAGVVPNAATYVEVVAGGAAGSLASQTLGAADSGGAGSKTFSGTFTVGAGTGAQTVQARARNALGTYGISVVSGNSITLNQTYPTIGTITIAYPSTEAALKGSETATVSATITNQDTVAYTGTNISIASPSAYASSKTVTRTGGTYSFGVNDYTITATKTSNNAVTVANAAVTIANTAATAAITISPTGRLLSSATGQSYTVTVTADQRLNVAPTITASSGTWQGSWAGGPQVWTRVLKIVDTDAKGSQTFAASLTNLANVVSSTISSGASYTVGGFSTRTLTFPAFAQYTAIGTNIVDVTKVTAAYTNSSTLTRYADTGSHFQGFTIVDSGGTYSATGGYLFITDADFAGSNTSGTLQVDLGESA